MATRAFGSLNQDMRGFAAGWSGLLNGDDGAPVELSDYADRSLQVGGTFGGGGSVRIEGSNDGVSYFPLSDPQGNVLNITAPGIEQVQEITRYIRPRVTAGDGTTNLVVIFFGVRRS